ncbi:MAG: ABC transporter permease [Nitrososphaerota archaeon]|nr:ABC transporter permease [Nitrososphaerota archaeon]MDG7048536.1 ABC transporter permease [Nitrososphaerota archaeon]MDG7051067.1 ABC transporter permease [Nitrososphaerota archaeon]
MANNIFYDIYIIMKKDLTEFMRIRARLVTMILLPIILIVLFGYMFPSTGSITHISIAVVNQDQSQAGLNIVSQFISSAQSSGLFNVISMGSLSSAQNQLVSGNVYAIIIFHQGLGQQLRSSGTATVQVIIDQANPSLDAAIQGELTQIFSSLRLSATLASASSSQVTPIYQGLIPQTSNTIEFLAPGLIAMTTILAGLSGLAMTFSREKELGTLDGLLMTPISRLSIILGKGFAQVVRGLASGVLVFILAMILFGVHIYGSIWLMALVLTLGILAFTGMGIIATSFVSDQESAQLIMMMIQFPMIFLSGALYPVIQLPSWLRIISDILPLTYVISAFRSVMLLNAPFSAISGDVYILLIFTLVVFAIALPLFQRTVTK